MRSLDGPLMWHEVVLMEKLRALRGNWDQPLRLADVAHYDVTYIGVELFSSKLQLVVGP